MIERILGVFKLDKATFESIEHDPSANSQAAIIVAIIAVLGAVGSLIGFAITAMMGEPDFGGLLIGVVVGVVATFINWGIWAGVTYLVGTNLFEGEATFDEMLRLTGFAMAPQMLQVIPCIGGIVGGIWSLVAGYFAIREGLDLDDTKTLITVAVGWLITVVIGFLLGLLAGGGMVGLGMLSGMMGG